MNIELPKDAEGREIPLDTEVLYDKEGKRREVDWYTFYPDKDIWDVVLADSSAHFSPHNLSITPQDSWEKLEDDLQRIDIGGSGWFCMYAGYGKDDNSCHSECKFFEDKTPCDRQAARDIVSRIRKLRGDTDA